MSALAETVVQTANHSNDPRTLLHQEQKRLAKLWDAFKKQEDEYRAVEKERDQVWDRVQELEKTLSILGPQPERALTRLDHMTRENDRLRREVSELGARLEENRSLFHQEQARLAKLYKVYEDTEAELARLRDRLGKEESRFKKTVERQQQAIERVKKQLTKKQLAQRKYAAQMRLLRQRAKTAPHGRGLIKNRAAAKKLRKELGVGQTKS